MFRFRGCSENWMPLSGQYGMDPVGHGGQEVLQKFPGRFPVGLVDQLRHRKFARSVNGDEQIELSVAHLRARRGWKVPSGSSRRAFSAPCQDTMEVTI